MQCFWGVELIFTLLSFLPMNHPSPKPSFRQREEIPMSTLGHDYPLEMRKWPQVTLRHPYSKPRTSGVWETSLASHFLAVGCVSTFLSPFGLPSKGKDYFYCVGWLRIRKKGCLEPFTHCQSVATFIVSSSVISL